METERILDYILSPDILPKFIDLFYKSDTIKLKITNKRYTVQYTPRNRLRYYLIGNITFIQQNPDKGSYFAFRVRKHHEKLIWIIIDGNYYGRIHNGKFVKS